MHTFHTLYAQEKYEATMTALSEMEKRAVMAETMLEATKQYQAGQVKAVQTIAPRYVLVTSLNFHPPNTPHYLVSLPISGIKLKMLVIYTGQ